MKQLQALDDDPEDLGVDERHQIPDKLWARIQPLLLPPALKYL